MRSPAWTPAASAHCSMHPAWTSHSSVSGSCTICGGAGTSIGDAPWLRWIRSRTTAFEVTGACGTSVVAVAAADEVFGAAERAGLALLRPESPPLAALVALGLITQGHLFRGEVRAARAIVDRADDHPALRDKADLNSLTLRMSPYADSSAASAADRLAKSLAGGSGALRKQLLARPVRHRQCRGRATSPRRCGSSRLRPPPTLTTARADSIAAFLEILRTYAALRQGDLDRLRDFETAQRVFISISRVARSLATMSGAFCWRPDASTTRSGTSSACIPIRVLRPRPVPARPRLRSARRAREGARALPHLRGMVE